MWRGSKQTAGLEGGDLYLHIHICIYISPYSDSGNDKCASSNGGCNNPVQTTSAVNEVPETQTKYRCIYVSKYVRMIASSSCQCVFKHASGCVLNVVMIVLGYNNNTHIINLVAGLFGKRSIGQSIKCSNNN